MRTALLAAAFVCFIATNAGAQANYTVTDLGYLPGGLDTTAVNVNNLGHVVGAASDANNRYVAFFYAGSLVPLGTLGGGASKANGINDADLVVGWATTAAGDTHAFAYDAASAQQMIDLHGVIGFGGTESRATAVNNSGQIVGVARVASGSLHAFLLTGNTVRDLHASVTFGGLESVATGITDNGLVVGSSADAAGNRIAFVYNLNTSTLTNLGTLGGADSAAQAVNGAGSVVGLSDILGGASYAFQTSPGSTLAAGTNLGALGGTSSSAFGINASGRSVGEADDAAGGAHAFIYSTSSGMQDLETMIPANSGWTLSYGAAINDSGAITGVGVHNGTTASFLLVPTATQVTVDTSPTGLTIVVDGVSDISPKVYQWASGSQHQVSTTEPQQVTAGSRLMFSGWSDSGALTHTVTTPASPVTFTATFKTQYLLTTAANPPAGGSITPGDWFDSGTSVGITATAAFGYGFTGFSGDLSGTTNPNSVAMDAARAVTANFKGLTTTSLGTSPNPNTFGQAVTMTATVMSSAAGLPSGTVTFKDGGAPIGTGLLNSSGQATFSTSSLSVGLHSITAEYGGDTSFLGSLSSSLPQTVTPISTTTTLYVLPPTTGFLQPIIAIAVVAPVAPGTGMPTGIVQFNDGTTPLGPASLSGGFAYIIANGLTPGAHAITATFAGGGNFAGSTSSQGTTTVSALSASTFTFLVPQSNPQAAGLPAMLVAAVIPLSGGTPTGSVQFSEGNTVVGTAPVNGGVATLSPDSLGVGTHVLTARYAGSATFAGSVSPPAALTIYSGSRPAATAVTVASSKTASTLGESVTFTATVTGGATTGNVSFYADGVPIGQAPIANVGGSFQATLATAALTTGLHVLSATYGGNAGFAGSSSLPAVQAVQAPGASSLTFALPALTVHAP